jgi:hypothetical protein
MFFFIGLQVAIRFYLFWGKLYYTVVGSIPTTSVLFALFALGWAVNRSVLSE